MSSECPPGLFRRGVTPHPCPPNRPTHPRQIIPREKSLAARAHGIPFYVALPSSTYDPATPNGAEVPIEERSGDEVAMVWGEGGHRALVTRAPVRNPAFDITPASLVTGYVTEAGIAADAAALAAMLREPAPAA